MQKTAYIFLLNIIVVLVPLSFIPIQVSELHAHRSGCHRWHSCPSDRGTYVCGDTGHCSQCPDNRYCEAGRPRSARAPERKVIAPTLPRTPPPARSPIPQVAVTKVIDGDTFHLASGESVRIVGIDAPERDDPFGPMATKCLKDILNGQKVRIVPATEPRDKYGRMLAWVYTEDGTFVNVELLRRGCAWLMVIPPNFEHLKERVSAQEAAKGFKRGVWK